MKLTTTFRHIEATDALKDYAHQKVGRLQRFLRQPMRAKVTLSLEKLEHQAEVQIKSGSQWYEAKQVCEDMYASIDAVMHKLERQINHAKGVESARRRKDTDLRHAIPDQVAVGGLDR